MKNQVKQMVLTALFIAIGVVLPQAFHAIPNAGSVMLPMHIPVLLAGLVCGPVFGLACGVLTPTLSSLITGMPPMAYLPSMLCELAIYGLVSGLVTKVVKTGTLLENVSIYYTFEYGVISKGSQTLCLVFKKVSQFEYGVISKGSQTFKNERKYSKEFEYGVISKGSQTGCRC